MKALERREKERLIRQDQRNGLTPHPCLTYSAWERCDEGAGDAAWSSVIIKAGTKKQQNIIGRIGSFLVTMSSKFSVLTSIEVNLISCTYWQAMIQQEPRSSP